MGGIVKQGSSFPEDGIPNDREVKSNADALAARLMTRADELTSKEKINNMVGQETDTSGGVAALDDHSELIGHHNNGLTFDGEIGDAVGKMSLINGTVFAGQRHNIPTLDGNTENAEQRASSAVEDGTLANRGGEDPVNALTAYLLAKVEEYRKVADLRARASQRITCHVSFGSVADIILRAGQTP